jgi:predicted phage baseplate assembly protein
VSVPRLDDRTYSQLLEEARAVIPAHAPEWTDHNPSDPGIALLELFAWLAEMLIYRADQITDRQTLAFVRLLRGPDWTPDPSLSTASEVSRALAEVRERWRAVTPEDY